MQMSNAVAHDGFATMMALIEAFARRSAHRIFDELPRWFLGHDNRFYWVYLLSFVILGVFAYRRYYRGTGAPGSNRGLLRFLFPPEVYRHPSAIIDYQLVLMNRLLGPAALLAGLFLGSASVTAVAQLTQHALADLAGGQVSQLEWTFRTSLLFALGITVVQDFTTFVTHGLSHRVPLLWEFHKVHHSAAVLTPLTVNRKHPVYNLLGRAVDLAVVGPVQGLFAFLFVGQAEPVTLFGANIVFSLFHLAGANLRHSHIWLPFGQRLSHVFISPAQHQIHHSMAPRHWNKNFGEVFAVWDWLCGTLYVPSREREVLEFGIPGSARDEHSTLLKVYFVPFINCVYLLQRYLHADARDEVAVPLDSQRE